MSRFHDDVPMVIGLPRKIITEQELDRWNHIRQRAGLEPITIPQANEIINRCDRQTKKEILDRIRG